VQTWLSLRFQPNLVSTPHGHAMEASASAKDSRRQVPEGLNALKRMIRLTDLNVKENPRHRKGPEAREEAVVQYRRSFVTATRGADLRVGR